MFAKDRHYFEDTTTAGDWSSSRSYKLCGENTMRNQIYPENKNIFFDNSFEETIKSSIKDLKFSSNEKASKKSVRKISLNHRRILFGCLAFLFIIGVTSSVIAQTNQTTKNSDWIGSYYFSEIAPISKRRNRQDVVPSTSYDITIEEKGDKLSAAFSATGVQLFEAYDCSVVVKNKALEFYFQKLGSEDIQNFRGFKKGDLLFSLSKTGSGKTAKYLFEPAAYKIIRVIPAKQKTPVYFEKSDAPLSSTSSPNENEIK